MVFVNFFWRPFSTFDNDLDGLLQMVASSFLRLVQDA